MHSFLEEDNNGVHEVCQYPCYEEWQEYRAKIVEYCECDDYDSANDYPADEFVECYFLRMSQKWFCPSAESVTCSSRLRRLGAFARISKDNATLANAV